MLQACNGLMLLGFNDCFTYVHNVTTRRSRKIAFNRNNELRVLVGIGLAFDPSKSPYYKMISVYLSNPEEDRPPSCKLTYEVEVYDSESHSWKLALEAAFVTKICYSDGCETHCNNKIYWRNRRGGYCYFDIDKNEMKTLSFPEMEIYGEVSILRESNGRLFYCGDASSESVGVWELVGDDDGTTSTPRLIFKHAVFEMYDRIVGLMAGSDGDETCSLLTHTGGKTIRVIAPCKY